MPLVVGRVNVLSAPYVITPLNEGDKTYLIPDSVPLFALYCREHMLDNKSCKGERGYFIGTLLDLKSWYLDTKRRIRFKVDLILSVISILMGLYAFYQDKSKNSN